MSSSPSFNPLGRTPLPAALSAGRPRYPTWKVESRLGPRVTGAKVFVGKMHLEDLELGGPWVGGMEPEPHFAHPGLNAGGVDGHETKCLALDLGEGVGLEPAATHYERGEFVEQLRGSPGISINHDELGMVEAGETNRVGPRTWSLDPDHREPVKDHPVVKGPNQR